MKIKTSELIGPALDWAVAKCEKHNVTVLTVEEHWLRLIEGSPEHEIAALKEYVYPSLKPEIKVLNPDGFKATPTFEQAPMAFNAGLARFCFSTSWLQGGPIIEREKYEIHNGANGERVAHGEFQKYGIGPTALIAAMRCHVASRLGDEVDVPEELLK